VCLCLRNGTFPDLPQETLSEFEDVKNWKKHDIFSPEGGWLRGFLFILDGDNIPEINTKGKLPEAIREFCGLMKRDEGGLYVETNTLFQVIFKGKEHAEVLEGACEDVKSRLPELQKKLLKARLSVIAQQ